MKDKKIKELIEKYEATGRIAFFYPRKRRISLNGSASMPINEAITRIKEVINEN